MTIPGLIKSSSAITIGVATLLVGVAVAWGMQIHAIEALEADIKDLRVEIHLLRRTAFLNNVAEGFAEQLDELSQSIGRIEKRMGKR